MWIEMSFELTVDKSGKVVYLYIYLCIYLFIHSIIYPFIHSIILYIFIYLFIYCLFFFAIFAKYIHTHMKSHRKHLILKCSFVWKFFFFLSPLPYLNWPTISDYDDCIMYELFTMCYQMCVLRIKKLNWIEYFKQNITVP